MKRLRLSVLFVACLLAPASRAGAQTPSPYAGAEVLPINAHVFGAYVPLSSNAVGALAQLRLSFLPGVDFGFQGGISRLDRSAGSKTLIRLGTDVKFQVAHPTPERPIAMAIGGGLSVFAGDDYNVLTLGPSFVASRTWRSGQSGQVTPYAGIGFALSTLNAGPVDETDFAAPLRVGCELGVTPTARLVAEFVTQLGSDFGDDTEFALGVNLPF